MAMVKPAVSSTKSRTPEPSELAMTMSRQHAPIRQKIVIDQKCIRKAKRKKMKNLHKQVLHMRWHSGQLYMPDH